MATGMQLFTTFLLVQLFYAIAVTLIVPTLPNVGLNQVVYFTDSKGIINITSLYNSIQQGISNQTNTPLLDFGALIFYSANTIISLMLNFFTAIPQMITMLLSAFFLFVPVFGDTSVVFIGIIQMIITIIYMIAVLSFFMSAVSGRSGSVPG